ncbi:hypothetical protein ATCV1_z559R [Acanthocystis turfacea chlorella virus 1]|uniref:Uncharacterized protein z559R n=1 Tax=Chlorovirus heliozoae TaxID=322019 RepID=A7K9G9_9PHYC|nr:hypothetical protein ATCV1_z559R [Acanthocystis turfacea chlorella virus 1]ABT16693.1 hypothetical protein ATCV1_z559R [Acanthocystis turfacea chlorella virus 1]
MSNFPGSGAYTLSGRISRLPDGGVYRLSKVISRACVVWFVNLLMPGKPTPSGLANAMKLSSYTTKSEALSALFTSQI